MLLVGARADLGVPMIARQRIGDELVALVVLEVVVVGQQVEDEDFHFTFTFRGYVGELDWHQVLLDHRVGALLELRGTSRPSALAVLRLIISSNLTGAWTGSSLGLAPLRMRSA